MQSRRKEQERRNNEKQANEEKEATCADFLPYFPAGLVNINFGVHACVHLGTQLTAQVNISFHVPLCTKRKQYPADYFFATVSTELSGRQTQVDRLILSRLNSIYSKRLYTVLLLDAEVKSLNWMVINVPGTALRDGQVVFFSLQNIAKNVKLFR